jgi:methionyl-tRNA formyltransferase
MPPVKEYALKTGIPALQPAFLNTPETEALLASFRTDVFIVVAYGRLLPKSILAIPPLGCVNVHASLLPKYRGAAPIQWAVINGERTTGVTTMYMSEGMDSGDMIDKAAIEIGDDETFGSVYGRLMELGAGLIVETLKKLENGTVAAVPQNHAEATFAPPIKKEHCAVDWSQPPESIYNRIRGLDPKPGAFASINGAVYKLFFPQLTSNTTALDNGCLVGADKNGLEIACGGGRTIVIREIQAQGGNRMKAADYL